MCRVSKSKITTTSHPRIIMSFFIFFGACGIAGVASLSGHTELGAGFLCGASVANLLRSFV